MSSVNVAEVYAKLHSSQTSNLQGAETFLALLDLIIPFTAAQAKLSGELIARTSSAGLSLGDRACIAAALELGGEVVTADRAWAQVDVGCTVHLLR